MLAYHATRAPDAVRADGFVRPMRMLHVYCFGELWAAAAYAEEFGYPAVVVVEIPQGMPRTSWRPAYANGGTVYKVAAPLAVVNDNPLGDDDMRRAVALMVRPDVAAAVEAAR